MTTIGICGTGRMGSAMAERLLKLGRQVTVWNRTSVKLQPLLALGARAADQPRALAAAADVIITMMTDESALDAVFRGPDSLLAGEVSGKLFIEMSTVQPHTERALAQLAQARGAAFIDCPVGGSTFPAREGKLFGFAGGSDADVTRARPVLEQLCRRIEHVGPVGAGASMKLAINLPLLVYWQALGEALALCKPLALDPQRLMDIIADTNGAPTVLKARGGAIVQALRGQDTGAVSFDIDSIRKDLRTMIQEATALGTEAPVTAQALRCYDEAAKAGLGPSDCVLLPVRWARRGAQGR